jgi:hypothetical protein
MNTLTRSPVGGWVTVAVTRHEPSRGSMTEDSMVVFGSESFFRLSHEHTGATSG